DRWWQMEFFRRTGRGELQELTGKTDSLMGTDIFIRTAGWRRAAERDLEALPEEVVVELQAFADGVNAYIESRPASELAFEYNVLGLTGVDIPIMPWTPLDTVVWTKVMAWDLSNTQGSDRAYGAMIDELGQDMADAYFPDFPYGERPTILQPEDVPSGGSTTALPTTSVVNATSSYANTQLAGNFDDSVGLIFGSGDGIGSNDWVVSGDLTESGMPLLANDPHLGIQMPSIWYEIGLHCQPVSDECPVNARGFTFAASPGIVIGHNDNIGWGVTNVGWDVMDVYEIKVNPDNPLQYEWNGEWRDMTVYEEEIRFGDGAEPVTIQARETHLGPIINDNQIDEETGEILGFNNEDPIALRWTAYEPSRLVEAILKLNVASNWDEFRDALRLWNVPSQNFVYADVEGNIGYQAPGQIPVRPAGSNGRTPLDGSSDEFEWLGFVPFDLLPTIYNPERGWIATANQALVPLEYYDYLANELADEYGADAHYVFSYSWAQGYRGQRIVELLQENTPHSFETFQMIHGDNKMIVAEDLTPALRELDMGDETLNEARDWMLDWDYQMHMDSPQAALFGIFWTRLVNNLYEDQTGDIADASGNSSNMLATTRLMDDPENPWWDDVTTADVVETRDEILIRSFTEAHAEAIELMGENRDDWAWGKLHTATFVSNPLGLSGIGPIEDIVNYGPVAASGGPAIVNATRWSAASGNYEVVTVPSMRMILDFSDLSNSVTVHTTGQSGHPYSPHYSDMVDDWRMIQYHPMLWERADVEANASSTLIIQPNAE
ncbi:MAG: penicillin acylase family protein, partial [Anaerolineae bacterium]|nr:penicillin acylase family protein [Anaerolineae bacterium]